ncbi:hypothetical protein OA972_00695 [Prochlorococcus sp. AH-716-B03]|nr:hypothetical protein [Prochlorococcus sp. AH-716-B03]
MLISVDSRTFLLSKLNKIKYQHDFLKKSKFKNLVILSENRGPQQFLSDLIITIEKNRLAKITYNCFKSDVHIINAGYYSSFWKYLKPKEKEKVILRLDGVGIDNPNNNNCKIKSDLLNLINKCSFLIYQSNFCKNCFLDIFDSLPEGKIIVNGAREQINFHNNGISLLKKINLKFSGRFFTVAGRFSSRKRIDEVINQFNEADIGNLVVLSDVPNELRHRNPRIIYLGMIDPVSARYIISNSIALIHFDKYDWCPNIVIGAIYDKTPVICSNFGGTPEITGSNGLIVNEFPEDLPQNLEGIEYVNNKNFPENLFKEIIYNINLNGIKINSDRIYDINDTAHDYVENAMHLSKKK